MIQMRWGRRVRRFRTLSRTIDKYRFPNGYGDDAKGGSDHQSSQVPYERRPPRRIVEEEEWACLPHHISLVQDNEIVAEVGELQSLHLRADRGRVSDLFEHAERKDEHGIRRLDVRRTVIAAFVDINDVVAESRGPIVRNIGRHDAEQPISDPGLS
jgi:hypothetical protein